MGLKATVPYLKTSNIGSGDLLWITKDPTGVNPTSNTISAADFAAEIRNFSNGSFIWSVATSNTVAIPGRGYLADSSNGAFTITLPAVPSMGDSIAVKDAGMAFTNNNVTIARNGSTIIGVAEDLILDINGAEVNIIASSNTNWVV